MQTSASTTTRREPRYPIGKSLLLSTIAAFFQGKKHLFEGLAINEGETEWAVHPVNVANRRVRFQCP